MYLTNTSLNNGTLLNPMKYNTQAKRYLAYPTLATAMPVLDTTTGLPLTSSDPSFSFPSPGFVNLTFSSGSGTTNGFIFTRASAAPSAPFNADIALALDIVDADGVMYANPALPAPADPALFSIGSIATAGNGMAFSGGKNFYYGRMHAQNASGSELLPLLMNVQTQYYVSAGVGGVFVTNAADNCTPLVAGVSGNVGRANFQGNLTAAQATPTITSATFVNGVNTINFSAPGAGKNGAMDIVLNLEPTNTPVTCLALAGVTATTGANLPWLRDVQSCSPGAYSQDPTAHVTFGVYNLNPNSIYLRENY
jgi:hypothetical protein